MYAGTSEDITQILDSLDSGDQRAVEELFAVVYDQLYCMAAREMKGQPLDHTWQPTALVHETYLRLFAARGQSWRDRAHFFRTAAKVMRRILVSHARRRNCEKRGGGRRRQPLDSMVLALEQRSRNLVALDEALNRLADLSTRQGQVVELRFFGGLTMDEVADVLGVSRRTAATDWQLAKLWLLREIDE